MIKAVIHLQVALVTMEEDICLYSQMDECLAASMVPFLSSILTCRGLRHWCRWGLGCWEGYTVSCLNPWRIFSEAIIQPGATLPFPRTTLHSRAGSPEQPWIRGSLVQRVQRSLVLPGRRIAIMALSYCEARTFSQTTPETCMLYEWVPQFILWRDKPQATIGATEVQLWGGTVQRCQPYESRCTGLTGEESYKPNNILETSQITSAPFQCITESQF